MSLAQVVYPPPTANGFEEWAFAHLQHHKAIIGATVTTKGLILPLYPIYPFFKKNVDEWLRQHQALHSDMNAVYGLAGQDLSTVDFQNKKQFDSWAWLNWNEHRNVGEKCGVAI